MAEPGSIGEIQARNRAGDLDYVPAEQPDTSTWLERVYGMLRQGGWQDPQPGQRGTFVPGQVGQDGKVSPAVPGIIQQPAESLQSLMTAPLGDIVRSGDRDAIRAASEASFDVASMLPAAGVAAGRTIPEGAAGIFGGRLAKTADQAALKRAEDMAAKGAPREDIWNDTGWFKGVDGQWRFEIDDSKSAMASDFKVGDLAPLPEALQHPDLYRAYDMSRVTAERVPGPSSMIFEDNMQIGGKSSNDARLGGLHEAQHRVQKEEGFARGGSPQSEGRIDPSNDPTVASRQRVFDSLKEAQADAFNAYTAALRKPTPLLFGRKQHEAKLAQLKERVDRIAEQRAAAHSALMEAITVAPSYDDALGWSRYNRLAGEVEARTTQSRADLTPEQRRARPPWLDYDVPENQQIVRLASNPDDLNTSAVLAAMQGLDQPIPPARLPQQMMERGSIGDQRPDIQARELQWQMPRERGAEVSPPAAPANANEAGSIAQMKADLGAVERILSSELPPQRQNLAPDTPGVASLWKTPRDAINASMSTLKELQHGYGASMMSSEGLAARRDNLAYPPPADTHRMINVVADGIRSAKPPKTPYGFGYQITDSPSTVKWVTAEDGDTLVIGTKATADDVEKAIRSKVGPDGRWKHGIDDPSYRPDDGLYGNPDDPTTAAILALLTQQQGGQQQQ